MVILQFIIPGKVLILRPAYIQYILYVHVCDSLLTFPRYVNVSFINYIKQTDNMY